MTTTSFAGPDSLRTTAIHGIHTARFEALGTGAVVAVTREDCLADAVAAVRETVAAFDLACSRFRADSELEALNAAAGEPVAVSPLLLEAVAAALRAAHLTYGAVDPTVGRAMLALGYDRDFGDLPQEAVDKGSRPQPFAKIPGWRVVTLDPDAGTVRLPRGVSLDLGATAKALAADKAAAAANSAGCDVLVSLGGDIATTGAPPAGWPVRVTDDHRAGPEAPGQWITLEVGGLATSSVATRRWTMPWGPVHHVLDPATAMPAGGPWRTATVAAASCLDANTASTAAIVYGERAQRWLDSLALPSRLVGHDGRALHLSNWPTAGDDLLGVSVGEDSP